MAFKVGTTTIVDHPLDVHLIDFKAVIHDDFSTYSDETWKCEDKIIAQFKFCKCSNSFGVVCPSYPNWGFDQSANNCNPINNGDMPAHQSHHRSMPPESNFHTYWCCISCTCALNAACSGCICHCYKSWASTTADGFMYFFDLCESFQNICPGFWKTGGYGNSFQMDEYDLDKSGYFICDRYCTAKGFGITQNPGT